MFNVTSKERILFGEVALIVFSGKRKCVFFKRKRKFYNKKEKSLKTTQKYFNESKSLSPVELKEFSLLYIVLNNLDVFHANIHLIENIKFFTNENKLVLENILQELNLMRR